MLPGSQKGQTGLVASLSLASHAFWSFEHVSMSRMSCGSFHEVLSHFSQVRIEFQHGSATRSTEVNSWSKLANGGHLSLKSYIKS